MKLFHAAFAIALCMAGHQVQAGIGDTYECLDFDNTVYSGTDKQDVEFFSFTIRWLETTAEVQYKVLQNPNILNITHQDENSFLTHVIDYQNRGGHTSSSFYKNADGSASYVRTFVIDGFSSAFMARCQKTGQN